MVIGMGIFFELFYLSPTWTMEEVNTGELKTFPIPVVTNLSNHTAEIKGQELMVLFVPYTAPVVLFDVHFKDNGDNK